MSIDTWIGSELKPTDGMFYFDDRCLKEIETAIILIRDNPLPLLMLRPDSFTMPRCRELMEKVFDCLENGLGFCLIDKLPLGSISEKEAKSIYWLLSQKLW